MCNPPPLSLLDSTMDVSLAELQLLVDYSCYHYSLCIFQKARGIKVRLRRHLSPLANVYKSFKSLQG